MPKLLQRLRKLLQQLKKTTVKNEAAPVKEAEVKVEAKKAPKKAKTGNKPASYTNRVKTKYETEVKKALVEEFGSDFATIQELIQSKYKELVELDYCSVPRIFSQISSWCFVKNSPCPNPCMISSL